MNLIPLRPIIRCAVLSCSLITFVSPIKADTFTWFETTSGAFADPGGWWVPSDGGILFPIKNPNPNGRVPSDGDSVSFTRGTATPGAYEVSIVGARSVAHFGAGSFGIPALTQPLTFNVSGTLSAGILEISDQILVTGSGALSGGPGSSVRGVRVTGGSRLAVSGGLLDNVILEQAEAVLTDAGLDALILTESRLKTGGKIGFSSPAGVTLDLASTWEHDGSAVSGGRLKLTGASRFITATNVTVSILNVEDGSALQAHWLDHPFGAFVLKGASSIRADSVFLNVGAEISPAEISDISTFDAGNLTVGQGWLRVGSGSKLRTSAVQMGTGGGVAGILVTGERSEWFVADSIIGANVKVADKGSVNLGPAVTDISALVEGAGSKLEFGVAIGDGRLNARSGGIISGRNLVMRNGSAGIEQKNSAIKLTGALEIGVGGTTRFEIVDAGFLECNTASLGLRENGDATMTVTGPESSWRVHEELFLGEEAPGKATLSITEGGNVTVGPELFASRQSVSIGQGSTVSIFGANSVFNTRFVSSTGLGTDVGLVGPAVVNVRSGGAFLARNLALGSEIRGEGVVTVDGAGSRLDVAQSILVGTNGAKGTLNLRNGALAQASNLEVGKSFQENSVLVTGSDSSLTVSDSVTVGSEGTGTITVAARGKLLMKDGPPGGGIDISLGFGSGSKGTLVVDGGSSATTIAGVSSSADFEGRQMAVGSSGTGFLTISGGCEPRKTWSSAAASHPHPPHWT